MTVQRIPARSPVDKTHNTTEVRALIQANPTAILVYLYETQRRIEWLNEDITNIQRQVDTLHAIGHDIRTHRYVGVAIISAIRSTTEDMRTMRQIEAQLNGLRGAMEADFRRLQSDPGPGLPDAANGTHWSADELAQIVRTRTGMGVAHAAATLAAPLPQPSLIRPRRVACAIRNDRLIHRYGFDDGVCNVPDHNGNGNGNYNHTPPTTSTEHANDAAPMGASCLPGAMAGIAGDPAGILSYKDAYAASWQSQARLFANGIAVDNNTNRRRFIFKDGSYVDVQAHIPVLQRSADSRFVACLVIACAATAGAIVGGPVGSGVAGIAAIAATELAYPTDAAWQGYTIQYFKNNTDKAAWASATFYGWQRAQSIADEVSLRLIDGTGRTANFADDPNRFSWWRWRSVDAAKSPARDDTPKISMNAETQKLIETMAATTDHTAAVSPAIEPSGRVLSNLFTSSASGIKPFSTRNDEPLSGAMP